MDTEYSTLSRKMEYITIFTMTLIKIGDSVELYLPSIISKVVTCELQLSPLQEHSLALALYVSLSLTTLISSCLTRRFSQRTNLLITLYAAITATVLSSIVHSYETLICSRVILGGVVGINLGLQSLKMAESSSSKEVLVFAVTANALAFNIGGGLCGLLAYFFLEMLGWRLFILITSVPFFLPSIFLLHFCLRDPESKKDTLPKCDYKIIEGCNTVSVDKDSVASSEDSDADSTKMVKRIVHINLYNITQGISYTGAMILLPAILVDYNKSTESIGSGTGSACDSIQDNQYLWISIIFGLCNLFGKLGNLLLKKIATTVTIFTLTGFIHLVTTGIMVTLEHNHMVLVASIAVIQIFLGASTTESFLASNDRFFFSTKYLKLAINMQYCVFHGVIAFSNLLSEMMPYPYVIRCHFLSAVFSICMDVYLIFKY